MYYILYHIQYIHLFIWWFCGSLSLLLQTRTPKLTIQREDCMQSDSQLNNRPCLTRGCLLCPPQWFLPQYSNSPLTFSIQFSFMNWYTRSDYSERWKSIPVLISQKLFEHELWTRETWGESETLLGMRGVVKVTLDFTHDKKEYI